MFDIDLLPSHIPDMNYQESSTSLRILNETFISELYHSQAKSRQTQISEEDFSVLIRDFFAFREVEDLLVIYIEQLKWVGSHDISASWQPETVLPLNADNNAIKKKIKNILSRKTYFTACLECNRFLPTFHVAGNICHSCLEKNHGYVF